MSGSLIEAVGYLFAIIFTIKQTQKLYEKNVHYNEWHDIMEYSQKLI